jgi:hypothetical protein
MARMSIDDMVVRDPRIALLSKLCGLNRYETLGRLLEVWMACYDQVTPYLSKRIIDSSAGHEGFADFMVEAELASVDRSGRLRIHGARERIEYLNHKKRAGRLGGLKSGESRVKGPKQNPSTGGSTPQARGNPSASASASASVPSSAGASAPAEPDPPAPAAEPRPASAPFADQRSKLNHEIWTHAAAEHRRLQASGIDVNARAWNGIPVGEGARDLTARTLELATDATNVEHARSTHRHVIAVRVAEAKSSGSLAYLIPTRLWASASFWKAADLTPEQATRPKPNAQPGRPQERARTDLKPL